MKELHLCQVKGWLMGYSSKGSKDGERLIPGLGYRASNDYWAIFTQEAGNSKINISGDIIQTKGLIIHDKVEKYFGGKGLSILINKALTKLEYPSMDDIFAMHEKTIDVNDINGLSEADVLEFFTVSQLTTELVKTSLQNEYLIGLVTELLNHKEEQEGQNNENSDISDFEKIYRSAIGTAGYYLKKETMKQNGGTSVNKANPKQRKVTESYVPNFTAEFKDIAIEGTNIQISAPITVGNTTEYEIFEGLDDGSRSVSPAM